uniref:Secreted protein n=1 Tax=Ditylenchus dipsaci TaxID=166011 RepID=A0A915DKV4_9BILA
MIISLAFVPPTAIWSCFAQLQLHLPVELAPILNWFKRNYVGKRLVLRHKTIQLAVMILGTAEHAPRFPVNWWTCYERTLAGEDRTNNFAEAAHR